MLDKRGFLFTVTVFLILTYILISISVWVKSIETSERSFSEFYKESTVELTIDQITPAKMDNVTYIIMNRGLQRLDDAAINFPLKNGTSPDEGHYIRSAMYGLLVNGSADPSDFVGGDNSMAIAQPENSSMVSWANDLNSSLRAIGIYIDQFSVSNFAIGQSDIRSVNYSFDITLGLKDYTNTSAVARTYHITNKIDVSGLVDPALAHESGIKPGGNETVYRMFFFNDRYNNTSDMKVTPVGPSPIEGQDFVYGQLALASGSGVDLPNAQFQVSPDNRKNYILVGSFSDIVALSKQVYDSFAGYIITTNATITPGCNGNPDESDTFNPILYGGSKCTPGFNDGLGYDTDKPFIVVPGFNATNAPFCPTLDNSSAIRKCVLLMNANSPSDVQANPLDKFDSQSKSGLFDVELIRDFVMCGYYTQDPLAPSYLQRMMADPYTRNDSAYGIETFVIGNYANDTSYDTYSRLDRELYQGVPGVKIRGLPGCKNYYTCSDTPVTGIFAVSSGDISAYYLQDIACDNGAAGCDKP